MHFSDIIILQKKQSFCQIDEIAKIKIQTFVLPHKKSNIDETYIKKMKKIAKNKNIRKLA
jgi:hypothetical protein